MRVLKWTMSLAVLAVWITPAVAQQSIQTAFNYNLADETVAPADESAKEPAAKSNCGCNQEPACGCEEASCGCEAELRLR